MPRLEFIQVIGILVYVKTFDEKDWWLHKTQHVYHFHRYLHVSLLLTLVNVITGGRFGVWVYETCHSCN